MSTRRVRALATRLERAYGRRGWWPTTPSGAGAPRYDPGNPYRSKSDREVVEIAVGAVLTQNTAWTNVRTALAGLRAHGLFSVAALRRAAAARVEAAIRSSGYYRAKARKLRALAAFLTAHPPRRLRTMPTAPLRTLLLGVYGIGPETADSILCYGLDRPVAVADAYTRRVLRRLGVLAPRPQYEPTRALVEAALPREAAALNEFHARLVDLAKAHCRTTPVCRGCPARRICAREFA